ncbi:pilus assembly PilX N-terminal domain-containing protein [Pseudomonadota bacterium]
MINKIIKSGECKGGSSLLVTMLVMGILMTLVLGLSQLVFREIRSTADIVAAGKAYFAAEAGVENALLDLKNNLPGYQTEGLSEAEDGWLNREVELVAEEDNPLHYKYRIRNQGNAFPYFDDDEPIYIDAGVAVNKEFLYADSTINDNTYNILPLNETVTIPLFAVDENGEVKNIENFLIEYYVNFQDHLSPAFQNIKLNELDVLRWKIFGNPRNPDLTMATRTESISDFYPVITDSTSNTPTCIGTDNQMAAETICWKPKAEMATTAGGYSTVVSAWSGARECLISDAGTAFGTDDDYSRLGCDIRTFVNNHTRNYLTLTNYVNPDVIGFNPVVDAKKANIHYRIRVNPDTDEKIVREFASINSDGFASGDKVKQSIDVELGLRHFLPVFNFSLYRTDTGDSEYSPTEVRENPFGDLGTALGI